MNRKEVFANDEIYHVYNRGVDKRKIFNHKDDVDRFVESLIEMNSLSPIESIQSVRTEHRQESRYGTLGEKDTTPLVEILAYCLLGNHYHLLLKQISDNGISKFMHRIGGGYTRYFNDKHDRSGSLFQGKFKSKHIDTQEYLEYVSAYVHCNYVVHAEHNIAPQLKNMYIASSTEHTAANPYSIIGTQLFNPTSMSKDKYLNWAKEQARTIKKTREESNNFHKWAIE